jgi:DNA-binding transcriptional ArsR family regulator
MSTPEQGSPDPSKHNQGPSVIQVDSRTLRGLAHPVRVRLLGILRIDGPSTATRLAQRVGLSSAATSYHLRQLATYGFIVDAEDLSAGRERWWRAAHRVTSFDLTPSADPESAAEGEIYLRSAVEISAGNVNRYLDERPTLPIEWQGAGTLSDETVRLTPEQADDLARAMWAHVDALPREDELDPTALEGSRRVNVQLQVYPRAEVDTR